jgi:hypothetical protein
MRQESDPVSLKFVHYPNKGCLAILAEQAHGPRALQKDPTDGSGHHLAQEQQGGDVRLALAGHRGTRQAGTDNALQGR